MEKMHNRIRIFVLCSDINVPSGGIKQLYRHVDVLNKNGFSAFILHTKKGFRCTWFQNDTKVVYKSDLRMIRNFHKIVVIKDFFISSVFNPIFILACIIRFLIRPHYRSERLEEFKRRLSSYKHKNSRINKEDYLCIPEGYGPNMADIQSGIKKVILNQGPFNTFRGYSLDKNDLKTPYLNNDVIATIVFSEYNFNYMKNIFPQLKLYKVRYGFDPGLFNYCPQKKKQIAFISKKYIEDVIQVINIVKFRKVLKDFELVEIADMSERQIAQILKESLIFLSFAGREGFGMPAAEAMACGCIVIGFDGKGGSEFFKKEFCYPIEEGELITFANTVEGVINQYETDRESLLKKGKRASEYILSAYSLEREEADIVGTWKDILGEG